MIHPPYRPSEVRVTETPLNAEWRIADAADEEGRYRIVWEDSEGRVWEVCADLLSETASHIVTLHIQSLPPDGAPGVLR